MSQTVEIGNLIESSPELRGGRPRIAGTGVTVARIVGWYKLGFSPEEIVNELPHLSLAQVFAALTYYHANQKEIEREIEADRQKTQLLEERHVQARN
jgi:uncharacterized protein (DUF433 family)